MDDANSSSQLVASLTVEETLEVLLLCFEAAADAYPPIPFAYAVPATDPPEGTESALNYLIWTSYDLEDSPSSDELSCYTFPPPSLPTALARARMCDYFALLLEKEVDGLMKDFGAKAEWVQFRPRPVLATYESSKRSQLLAFSHSVLLVTLSDATRLIMDGTGEQFGWPRSSWLIDFHEFYRTSLRGSVEVAPDSHKQRAQDAINNQDPAYWVVAQERMEELFLELEWDVLKSLAREGRLEAVKKQAEAKFAGTWEEACKK
jgi:hypothetical protein